MCACKITLTPLETGTCDRVVPMMSFPFVGLPPVNYAQINYADGLTT